MRSSAALSSLLLCALAATPVARAHEFFSTKITWSREISRIVAKRCAACHRAGGPAFSLATFEEARPWAAAIKEEVLSRRMPPWGAAKGFGSFADDHGLSQDEISLIADWVEGGSPEGQRMYLPAATASRAAASAAVVNDRAMVPMPASLVAISRAMTVAGIAPRGAVPAGAQVTVALPDGSVEPLIWIVDPKAATRRSFRFDAPRTFPAGSRFVVSQAGGAWKLLLGPPPADPSRRASLRPEAAARP